MKHKMMPLAVVVACFATFSTAALAAAPAVATANVNLRAGPSTHFPVVTVVPVVARLVTFGCVDGYTWCDVAVAGNRGWLAAEYIRLSGPGVIVAPAVAVSAGVPVVAFNHAYWQAHYATRPWFGRWPAYAARWGALGLAPNRAPLRRGVRAHCLGAGCSASRSVTGPAGRSINRSISVTR